MKTSRLLLTLTTGLVLAAPLASYAEGTTTAPATATATTDKAASGETRKHHRRHHAKKDADAKETDATAKPTTK